jgi:hypothetical protein
MDLEALLAEAQAAIDAGANPEAVFAHARALGQAQGFNGDLGSIVKHRADAADFAREAEVINRVEDRGSLLNTAGMLAQGVTAGLLPDFLNLIGAEDASERFRGFVEENRDVHPILSGISEASGAIALPGLGAARGTAAISKGLTRLGTRVGGTTGGLLAAPATTAAVLGAGAGSAGGGLFGFTESVGEEPGERLRSTIEGATDPLAIGLGAGVGPLVGFGGSRMRRLFGSKSRRVAGALEEATGVSSDINAIRNHADLNIETAKAGLDVVERRTPEIVSEELEEFLDNIRSRADVSPNLTRASREVAGGERFANVRDMRRLRDNLRSSGNHSEASLLDDILSKDVPGFAEANSEFSRAKNVREAIEIGQRGEGKTFSGERVQLDTGANFEKALEVIPAEAHEALKTGVLHRQLQNILGERAGSSVEVLKKLADDSGIDRRLRSMFTDPAIAEEFIQGVDKEISTDQLRKLLVRGGVLIAIGAGARASFGSSVSGFLDQ